MFKHYLTTALRNFARDKMATAVNILGLTLGLMCLIGAFGATYMLTHTDESFSKADRIYFIERSDGNVPISWLIANYLASEFPDLEAIARVRPGFTDMPLSAEGRSTFASISIVEPAFLRIFNLPFVAGDPEHALDRPHSVVLKKQTAKQLFGTLDVIGRNMVIRGIDLTVTGVMDDIPQPSHLTTLLGIGELVSSDADDQLAPSTKKLAQACDWTCAAYTTYVLFPAGKPFSIKTFNQRLAALSARIVPSGQDSPLTLNGRPLTFDARPISQIIATQVNGLARVAIGIPASILILVVGGLIAATACINCTNLMVAQTVGRAKEIGLRKVMGAEQHQVFAQHLLEAGMQMVAAYGLAVLLFALISPVVAGVVDFNLFAYFAAQPDTWLFLSASCIVVSFVAGIFPALVALHFTPDAVTRASNVARGKRLGARILVGIQFGTVSLLLIFALIVASENRMLQQTGLEGFGDPIVVIGNNIAEAGISLSALRAELAHAPGVVSVSAIQFKPWGFGGWGEVFRSSADPAAAPIIGNGYTIADDFFDTMGIKLLAGRTLSAERAEDTWNETDAGVPRMIVVDEALAAQRGWSPEQAVGQTIYKPIGPTKPPQPVRIVGVVANRPMQLATMSPLTFYAYKPANAGLPVMRLDKRNVTAGLAAIDAAWARLAPVVPLKRDFMDDLFRSSYTVFTTVGAVIFALAAFAFCIAAAGLVGMATYAVSRLRREIGIRKVLGSTVRRALGLVLWDFSRPVIIANLVAWPVAFLAAQVYLSLFVTRVPLTPVPFVLAFLIALLTTWAAVGWHAWRAAHVNPAEVLHYE